MKPAITPKKGARATEQAEYDRIDLIKDHAEDLLTALKEVKAECAEINTNGDVYIPVDTLNLVLKAIDKAEPVDPNIIEGSEGDLMTLAEFNDNAECTAITDDDGYGEAVCRGKFAKSSDGSRIRVYPSQRELPSHVTHILWYNK